MHIFLSRMFFLQLTLRGKFSLSSDSVPDDFLFNIRIRDTIALPLWFLFRKSLNESIFQTTFKTSILLSLSKAGNSAQVENYRPIVNLSRLSKLFESLVFN